MTEKKLLSFAVRNVILIAALTLNVGISLYTQDWISAGCVLLVAAVLLWDEYRKLKAFAAHIAGGGARGPLSKDGTPSPGER